jgi:hypothetical protein
MTSRVPNYIEEKLLWRRTNDPLYPYATEFEGRRGALRLNDFPEEPLYTLLVDHREVASFDDWPELWTRPD